MFSKFFKKKVQPQSMNSKYEDGGGVMFKLMENSLKWFKSSEEINKIKSQLNSPSVSYTKKKEIVDSLIENVLVYSNRPQPNESPYVTYTNKRNILEIYNTYFIS